MPLQQIVSLFIGSVESVDRELMQKHGRADIKLIQTPDDKWTVRRRQNDNGPTYQMERAFTVAEVDDVISAIRTLAKTHPPYHIRYRCESSDLDSDVTVQRACALIYDKLDVKGKVIDLVAGGWEAQCAYSFALADKGEDIAQADDQLVKLVNEQQLNRFMSVLENTPVPEKKRKRARR